MLRNNKKRNKNIERKEFLCVFFVIVGIFNGSVYPQQNKFHFITIFFLILSFSLFLTMKVWVLEPMKFFDLQQVFILSIFFAMILHLAPSWNGVALYSFTQFFSKLFSRWVSCLKRNENERYYPAFPFKVEFR